MLVINFHYVEDLLPVICSTVGGTRDQGGVHLHSKLSLSVGDEGRSDLYLHGRVGLWAVWVRN